MTAKKILIVDIVARDRDKQRLITALKRRGFMLVMHTSNGDQAVDMMRDFKPELLIVHVSVTGKREGLEILHWVNGNHRPISPIKIIVISDDDIEDVRSATEHVGVEEFHPKPLDLKEVLKTVERLLTA